MGKKIFKRISALYKNPTVKMYFYIVGIIILLWFLGVFSDFEKFMDQLGRLFSAQETVSVFFAGIVSIAVAKLVKSFNIYMEESFKINDDHHKVINQYSYHKRDDLDKTKNFTDERGYLMHLRCVDKKDKVKNTVKDKFSGEYKQVQKAIEYYEQERLFLPTVNVFSNILGDTKINFRDKRDLYNLPDFVINNAGNLMAAHKNSKVTNSRTIRLTDFNYENGVLNLDTQRSTYFHMLITNRCMDYDFCDGLTVRNLYEYKDRISLLEDSRMGNQIGINGFIISKDGYLLVEKRDHKKTTWKNKLAQSISLALKEKDLDLTDARILGEGTDTAENNLKKIILKTIYDNYGITEEDIKGFSIADNFLGLARDLLEGGKPNMYFYVETNLEAKDLVKFLKEKSANIGKGAFKTGKLSSDYYLIPYEDVKVDFDYVMGMNRRNSYKVPRKVYPRLPRRKQAWDTMKSGILKVIKPTMYRECGEAFLVTLAYLEICKNRIESIKDK